MPRVTREQTAINQRAITDASARLIREHGIDGVSVADLMGAAGLTHGGFYGHFGSKDALAAAACTRAFEQSSERWRKRVAGRVDTDAALRALVEGYLSPASRDNPGTSCPAAALVNDVTRTPASAPVRAAYRAGVNELVGILTSIQQTGVAETDRRQALRQLATLVGALALARATAGDELSEEFLAAGRDLRLSADSGRPA